MVVWDKPWEKYREVQWDQVDCQPQPTSAAPLIGGGDHDFVPHSSEPALIGGDDHDLIDHDSQPAHLLGADGHDNQPHGEAKSPGKLLRVGLKKVQAAVRLGLVLPPTGEVAQQPLLGAGDHDFLPHVKKASQTGVLGAQAHGPRFDSEYATKDLLERDESKKQLKELQVNQEISKEYCALIFISQSIGHFHSFMTEHNKNYSDRAEFKRRYAIFRDNMKKVQFLRETELGTGEYGATALADLTETEFKTNYLGWKRQKDDPEVHWPAAEIPDVDLPKVLRIHLYANFLTKELHLSGARLEKSERGDSSEEPGCLWLLLGFLRHWQRGRPASYQEW